MTRATKLGSPAAGQSVLTRLCPSSRPSPSPAPLSAWEQGRSITVAIVFSNKQLQEAWAKFLSNLFPDDKYTPLIITVENNTNRSTNWVEGPAPWQESSKNEESKFILDEEQRKMTVHMKRRSSSVTKGWPGSECFSSVRDLISRQSEFYLTQFKSYRCPDYTKTSMFSKMKEKLTFHLEIWSSKKLSERYLMIAFQQSFLTFCQRA